MTEENSYLLLGSNLGDRMTTLKNGLKQIHLFAKILRQSSVYETAAWGKADQPNFLNLAIQIKTDLSAEDLLHRCLETEKLLGRIRTEKWEARTIDIDILYFGNKIIQTNNLVIPHPRITERRFVLEPLCELASDFIHPMLKKTNQQLLDECTDLLPVKKFTD